MKNNAKVEDNKLTINNAIEQFMFHCQYEKNLDIKTIKAYQIDLKQFYQFMIQEHTNIADIDKYSLKQYIQSIANFKPKTMKRKIASAKAMFNFLSFENDSVINPFHKIKVNIKEPKLLPTVMNIDEVGNILELLYSEYKSDENKSSYRNIAIIRNIAVIELLFTTGIRVSELCNLNVSDIDFNNENIKVLGKGHKERVIHICHNSVWEVLKKYSALVQPTNFFFLNRLGNPLSTQSVRLLVKKYASLSYINKPITPHTFRHTFATLLLEEDVDIKYIQNLLGHSSIITTQIYTHVSSTKQRDILSTKHPRLKINADI